MVGNQIGAVKLRAIDIARNANSSSGHRPARPEAQGRRLLPETLGAVACGGASSIASFDSGKPAFLPRSKSPEDLL
jgi:hypothetical protein